MDKVATLWIGARLSFLERLCLQSFVDLGQPVILYSYAPVADVPRGVDQRDAAEVMPTDRILRFGAGAAICAAARRCMRMCSVCI